ncbi:MAG: PAS domain S-box protein, partial [bacterium]
KNVLVDGEVFICLISPIFSFQDKFQGAILGVLNVKESLKEALRPIIRDSKDYAWILNEQGYLLYHPNHEDMLLRNIFESQETCFHCHQKFSLEKKMLTTSRGVGIKSNLQSPKQLIAYAHVPLENTKWIAAISSPFDSVTISIRTLFKNFLLLILFMMVTVIGGAVLINRINTKHVTAKKEIENLRIQANLINERNAAESRYRVLVEQSPDPIFLCSRKKFIMVNYSFEKLFGYSQEEVCSPKFSFFQIIEPSFVEQFKRKFEKFVIDRKPISSITLGMITKAGKTLAVEISLGRFLLGRKLVYQGIIHDVTKTKQLEREREHRKHLSLIGEMAARIAHEIKNPLASIQTGIQLLESQITDDGKQKSYYERLRGEIKRVDSILKGLLSYAREDQLNVKLVQINPIIRRFEELVKPTIQKHNLKLKIHMRDDLPQVFIDEQKIEQVLWNILLNAIQASKPGGRLYLNILRSDHGIDLRIRDEGSGIPEENLAKIFQPFFSTRTTGSGLGLAISKKIIELHKGQLKIESTLNRGTTVIIHLQEGKLES